MFTRRFAIPVARNIRARQFSLPTFLDNYVNVENTNLPLNSTTQNLVNVSVPRSNVVQANTPPPMLPAQQVQMVAIPAETYQKLVEENSALWKRVNELEGQNKLLLSQKTALEKNLDELRMENVELKAKIEVLEKKIDEQGLLIDEQGLIIAKQGLLIAEQGEAISAMQVEHRIGKIMGSIQDFNECFKLESEMASLKDLRLERNTRFHFLTKSECATSVQYKLKKLVAYLKALDDKTKEEITDYYGPEFITDVVSTLEKHIESKCTTTADARIDAWFTKWIKK